MPVITGAVTEGCWAATLTTNDFVVVPALFVAEQNGRIRIVRNGTVTGTFLTIPTVLFGGEQGLLGLAFHPNYGANRKFYVYYTTASGVFGIANKCVVTEYTASSANPDVADPGSARTILRFDHPQSNHNAGWIAFGPKDGYLYIASGDGGGRVIHQNSVAQIGRLPPGRTTPTVSAARRTRSSRPMSGIPASSSLIVLYVGGFGWPNG